MTSYQDEPGVAIPARLTPLAAYLLTFAVKEVERRNGGAAAMADLSELLDTVTAAARSVSGLSPRTVAVRADRTIPVSEAAAVAGVSQRHMRRLARSGAIRATKRGRDWLIDQDAASEYRERGRRTRWERPAA